MKFGRISKQTIIQLIGISDNYSFFEDICEVSYVQVITDSCKTCKGYATSPFVEECEHCCSMCKGCPFYKCEAQYTSKKIKKYKNEENYYGNKGKVGKSAIKLWTALHFFNPDDFGLVRGITMSEITHKIGLNTRQIRYALNQLTKNGYVAPSASIANCNTEFNVMITDYQKMYLTAEKGGKGYLTLSEDNLKEIAAFKNINELRAYLRLYLACDEKAVKNNRRYDNFANVKLSVAKKWLPGYLTISNIKAVFDNLKKYFDIDESRNENYTVEFTNTTDGKASYEAKLQEAKHEIEDYIDEINNLVISTPNSQNLARMTQLEILSGVPQNWKNKVISFEPNSVHMNDLAKLALEYGSMYVKKAISLAVRNFHFENKKINSWGALARDYIKSFS